jgi:hypothetical protein
VQLSGDGRRTTDDWDAAFAFMLQMDYLAGCRACLLLVLSYIFAFGGMAALNLPPDPYIESDRYNTVEFVVLLLGGAMYRAAAAELDRTRYIPGGTRTIGIKVLQNPNQRVVGTWLNPDGNIFVCLRGMHFFTVMRTDIDGLLMVYDNLGDGKERVVQGIAINWH